MSRARSILSEIGSLIVSTFTSAFDFIRAIAETFGPLLMACPQLILVLVSLYILPIITYKYSDYTIILTAIPVNYWAFLISVGAAIWNTISPVFWPIYALYWNTLYTIFGIVITALYKYACPGEFPPTDFNRDCPTVVRVITMVTTYIDAVESIISALLKVIVKVLTAVGSVTQQGITDHHQIQLQRATCTSVTCSEDDWVSTLKIIIVWLMDLIDWVLNAIMPVVFMTIGFVADIAMFIMSQLVAILLQRIQFIVNLFGGLITLLIPHDPDTVPNKSTDPNSYDTFVIGAVEFLQVDKTLTAYATGPQELKDFYLTILQLTSDVITTIYDIVMGFLQAVDKSQCYIAKLPSCILGNQCRFIFGQVIHLNLFCDKVGRDLKICIDFSQIIINTCNDVFGYTCACDMCPLKPTSVWYWILPTAPCNLNYIDPVTGGRCCIQDFSVVREIAKIMSGNF